MSRYLDLITTTIHFLRTPTNSCELLGQSVTWLKHIIIQGQKSAIEERDNRRAPVTTQEEQGTQSVGWLQKEGLKGIFNYQST